MRKAFFIENLPRGGDMKMTKKDALKNLKNDNVSLVELQFSDMFGRVKSLTTRADLMEDAFDHGVWFDGSSIEGFARIHESDMVLAPDPATYAILPWWSGNGSGKVARFICDVQMPGGEPFAGDPRTILRRAIDYAKKLGFIYNVGPEPEFFLFKIAEDGSIVRKSSGNGDYFVLSLDETYEIKREIINTLMSFGISVEMSHYEVANNQHEIDFRYGDALTAADNLMTLKFAVKKIAAKHGYYATFLPKPIYGVNGSGMHVHQSLFKKDTNAFVDASDEYGLSKIAYSFIAGQLTHIREISALVAPTVNSYKRLTPGFEAPAYICWARRNRSALIRIPEISEGRASSTRAELRCPDGSSNPYIAFAAMLRAGLAGVEDKLTAPSPVEEDVFEFDDAKLARFYINKLPGSLSEALSEMEKSALARDVLGEHGYKSFLELKRAEWDAFRMHVTDWEIDKYLAVF